VTAGEGPLDGVDIQFLDGELIVSRQTAARWTQPADEWVFDGVTYDVFGFRGPALHDGRQVFQVFVHRRPAASPDEQPDAGGLTPTA
jgi:hypothetical protein